MRAPIGIVIRFLPVLVTVSTLLLLVEHSAPILCARLGNSGYAALRLCCALLVAASSYRWLCDFWEWNFLQSLIRDHLHLQQQQQLPTSSLENEARNIQDAASFPKLLAESLLDVLTLRIRERHVSWPSRKLLVGWTTAESDAALNVTCYHPDVELEAAGISSWCSPVFCQLVYYCLCSIAETGVVALVSPEPWSWSLCIPILSVALVFLVTQGLMETGRRSGTELQFGYWTDSCLFMADIGLFRLNTNSVCPWRNLLSGHDFSTASVSSHTLSLQFVDWKTRRDTWIVRVELPAVVRYPSA